MNFPGLELGWNTTHRALHTAGLIHPWDLEQTRSAIERGARVLVVASTALGDSLLCTPLLKTLGEKLGPDRVGFLVRKPFAELYEQTPWIGNVFTSRGKFRGLGDLKSQLQPANYEIALIANCTEPDLVPWLWWCGIRGFLRYRTRSSHWANWFANQEMMRQPGDPLYATGHAVENNLAMAEALGISATSRRLELFDKRVCAFSNKTSGDFYVNKSRTPGMSSPPVTLPPVVLIHPGASRPGKCWPLERWASIAGELKERFGCRFIITGSASEIPQAGTLQRLMPSGTENRAGEYGLCDLANQQREGSLFLSGDTGPYHLAVAVGCPTVTLFAPRDRGSSVEACGPIGVDERLHVTLQTKQFNDPIESIPLDAVLQKTIEVLETSIASK